MLALVNSSYGVRGGDGGLRGVSGLLQHDDCADFCAECASDLYDVPGGCGQEPPVTQRQTRCSSRKEVGLEGLEGPDVKYFQLLIHSRCDHVAVGKTGAGD